jgi:hypothetical protein
MTAQQRGQPMTTPHNHAIGGCDMECMHGPQGTENQPMTQQLKSCPFCGGAPEIERKGTARVSMIIACTQCGARMESGDVYGMTKPESYRWNTRPSRQPSPPEDVVERGGCKWPVCPGSQRGACFLCPERPDTAIVKPLPAGHSHHDAASDLECAGYVEGWNACLAALAAGVTGQWRPIETAKKDGKKIAYRWDGHVAGECYWDGEDWYDDDADQIVHPTHWVPVPSVRG